MLTLAAGMPRAGSGWHYNLVHDLIVAAGGQDARALRRRYLLQPFLTEVNCNIRALSAKRLLPVMLPAYLGNEFAIKTHSEPGPLARRLMDNGRIRATYIYRDPRAALLSALEYGQRARAARASNALSALKSFEDALQFILGYVHIAEQWMELDAVHHLSYENFLQSYEKEVEQLINFLGVENDRQAINEVIAQYHPKEKGSSGRGLHFQHGEAQRFRQVLTANQLAEANKLLHPFLARMGYEI